MFNQILVYLGAALSAAWGIAHLAATRGVVMGFGALNADNRNIITMEWIVEGVTLIFIGLFVAFVTVVDPFNNISLAVYLIAAAQLIVLAVVSLFTGVKINFWPFKLCPIIFTVAAILIVLGGFL